MKKSVLVMFMVGVLALAAAPKVNAIENPYKEGTFLLNVQIGFVDGVGSNVSGDFVVENGWWKGHFTVGGYVGFNVYNHYRHDGADWHNTNIAFLPRATYGLNISNDFEVHAGIMTGFTVRNYEYVDDNDVLFCGGPLIGCRYFFSDAVGLVAETFYCGGGATILNAGLTFKF